MTSLLELFYNPERIFRYRLARNPYYPFTEVSPKVFVLQDVSRWYIVELIGVLAMAAGYVALVLGYGWSLQLLLIPFVLVAIVLPVVLSGRKRRTLVYDGNALLYEVYVDGEFVYQGHCHNLYIRLKCETGGTEEAHYYSVVVNGYSVREYPASLISKKRDRLFRMGRRLAANLDLNFFDCTDRSTNHVVRHYCPLVGRATLSHHEAHKGV